MGQPPTSRQEPGPVVVGFVADLARAVAVQGRGVQQEDPADVHDLRVPMRRLRSLLATFGPFFEPDVVPLLRVELAWVFGELGAARDAEVLQARLASASLREPTVGTLVVEALAGVQDAGTARARTALASERYADLLARLDDFASAPPVRATVLESGVDGTSAEDLPRSRVRRDRARLRHRMAAHEPLEAQVERAAYLHDVRKAAKRLRYSSEALVTLHGDDAGRLVRRTRQLQEVLGDVQDFTLTRTFLHSLADNPRTSTAQAFLLGELHEGEHRAMDKATRRYAWQRERFLASNPRWLR